MYIKYEVNHASALPLSTVNKTAAPASLHAPVALAS